MAAKLTYSMDSEPVVFLTRSDPTLRDLIDGIGPYDLVLRENRFSALARAIVGQQLSVAAASTIWSRLVDLVGTVTADSVAAVDIASLRSLGFSGAKANYVSDLAEHVRSDSLDLDALDALTDEEVITRLTQVKGIGRWTAEMFLIFSLGRLDVFAVDDVGLRRAIARAYGLPSDLDSPGLTLVGEAWRPYRSLASLYLWASLDSGNP
jgi:DNA-3-methyladenine glycosylase II